MGQAGHRAGAAEAQGRRRVGAMWWAEVQGATWSLPPLTGTSTR